MKQLLLLLILCGGILLAMEPTHFRLPPYAVKFREMNIRRGELLITAINTRSYELYLLEQYSEIPVEVRDKWIRRADDFNERKKEL